MPPIDYIEPYGIGPLGLFTPEELEAIEASPPGVLADFIDYGELDQAKAGRTPTFEFLSLTVGIHPIDEQVLTALTLAAKSGAAVLNDGNDFASVRKLGSGADKELEAIAKNALKRLIANGDVEIVSLKVIVDGDAAEIALGYRNLRATDSRRVRTQRVRIPSLGGVS